MHKLLQDLTPWLKSQYDSIWSFQDTTDLLLLPNLHHILRWFPPFPSFSRFQFPTSHLQLCTHLTSCNSFQKLEQFNLTWCNCLLYLERGTYLFFVGHLKLTLFKAKLTTMLETSIDRLNKSHAVQINEPNNLQCFINTQHTCWSLELELAYHVIKKTCLLEMFNTFQYYHLAVRVLSEV